MVSNFYQISYVACWADAFYEQNALPTVKLQFVIVSMTVLTEVYVYAWPADYMMDMVNHILPILCDCSAWSSKDNQSSIIHRAYTFHEVHTI